MRPWQNGARKARRWVKEVDLWQPQTTLAKDGVITADPLALLEAEGRAYAGLWQAGDAATIEPTVASPISAWNGISRPRDWSHR